MLCEKCGKNQATVMYTQIINGQKSSLNICSSCAAQESIFENFGSLLSFSPREEQIITACPVCKTTLSEFTRSGRVGCGECYKTFRKYADAMLRKIHGTSSHIKGSTQVAKPAPKPAKELSELEKLRAELQKAIGNEDFENAAVLRDKIREIEREESK